MHAQLDIIKSYNIHFRTVSVRKERVIIEIRKKDSIKKGSWDWAIVTVKDDKFLIGRSWILWMNPAETVGCDGVSKSRGAEETNAGVEHSICGDLEAQENQGACILYGSQGGQWRVVECRGRQNSEVWLALGSLDSTLIAVGSCWHILRDLICISGKSFCQQLGRRQSKPGTQLLVWCSNLGKVWWWVWRWKRAGGEISGTAWWISDWIVYEEWT